MATTEQVEKEIEISIEQAKEIVAKRDDILKLIKDPIFIKVIEEDYFTTEASRLVLLMADPEYTSEEGQQEIRNDMMGISAFRNYIRNVIAYGNQMERQIEASEKELFEIRNPQEEEEE